MVLKVLPSCYQNILFPKQSDGKGPKCGDIFLCMADDKNRKLWPQWPLVIVWHGFNSIQIYSPPPLYLTIHFKLFYALPCQCPFGPFRAEEFDLNNQVMKTSDLQLSVFYFLLLPLGLMVNVTLECCSHHWNWLVCKPCQQTLRWPWK